MSVVFDSDGFDDFESLLKEYLKRADDPVEILEAGASAFVDVLLKLPKPLSSIKTPGYTHLIDTFSYRESQYSNHKGEIEVGWGKRYGNVLEHGSYKMRAQKHLNPTFTKNKNKYYQKMVDKFHGGI